MSKNNKNSTPDSLNHGHEAWLAKATSDLKMARKGIKDDDETLDGAAYHTHQCMEKALKGYLVCKGASIKRTHDLEWLLELCMVFDINFSKLMTIAENLNPYALYSRYPDDRFSIDRTEVKEAIKNAVIVLSFVKKRIKVALHPNMKLFE